MTQAFDELKQQASDHLARLESKPRVRIGTDLSGLAAGAGEVVEAFRNEVASNKLDVTISEVGGIGLAYAEPLVDIQLPSQPRVFYSNVTPEQVPALVKEHLMGGKPAEGAMAVSGDGDSSTVPNLEDLPMMKGQVRIAQPVWRYLTWISSFWFIEVDQFDMETVQCHEGKFHADFIQL